MVAKVRVALEVNTVRAIAFWKSIWTRSSFRAPGRDEPKKPKKCLSFVSNPARTLCSGVRNTLNFLESPDLISLVTRRVVTGISRDAGPDHAAKRE